MLGVFATRIHYLPTSLEDIDSVNFDLGVHDFNPFADQPHPPGFAVFIGLAKRRRFATCERSAPWESVRLS